MKGNYNKIFIASFIAAGIVCLVTGLIVYFTNTDNNGLQMLIGITVTVVGAADMLVSVFVLLIVFIKERLLKSTEMQEKEQKDKNNIDK